MLILLDENIDPEFGKLLVGHDFEAVAGSDLRGIPDKEMLRLANQRFDALVTMDKSIIHQQNLKDNLLIISSSCAGRTTATRPSPGWRRRSFSSSKTPCPAR